MSNSVKRGEVRVRSVGPLHITVVTVRLDRQGGGGGEEVVVEVEAGVEMVVVLEVVEEGEDRRVSRADGSTCDACATSRDSPMAHIPRYLFIVFAALALASNQRLNNQNLQRPTGGIKDINGAEFALVIP